MNDLRAALEELLTTAIHAKVFTVSREKMHPIWQSQYDEAIAKAQAALARDRVAEPRDDGLEEAAQIAERHKLGAMYTTGHGIDIAAVYDKIRAMENANAAALLNGHTIILAR